METHVKLDAIYAPSDDIVAREIEGEIIIVPLVSGIGEEDDELFTLNETGQAIWDKLDEQKRLQDVVEELSGEFESTDEEIKEDVLGFVGELVSRKILIEMSGA